MSDVTIIINLPEELVERARAVGLQIEDQTDEFIAFVEGRVKRREAGARLIEVGERLQALPNVMKPTTEEIDALVKSIRAERTSKRQSAK